MGWFARNPWSVSQTKSRGNFCFKAFEVKEKTLDELKTHCSRLSSLLVTKDLIYDSNSTLKEELNFIMMKKFKLNEHDQEKVFGLSLDLKGLFSKL